MRSPWGHDQLLCEMNSATWRQCIVSQLRCQARGGGPLPPTDAVIPAAPASDSPPIPKGREVRFSDCGVSMRRFGGTQMSAAVKITHTDETPVTLRALAAKSRDTAQSRRLLAIAMVLEGSSRLEA